MSLEADGDEVGLLTRLVRVDELVVGAKECKVESALDQMELPNVDVVGDQGLRAFPRSDEVGVVGELELLGQERRGSLLGLSQMEEDTEGKGQHCWGSGGFGTFIPVNTPVKLKELLGPKAVKELVEWKLGLVAASMEPQRPELSELSLSTDGTCAKFLR